MIILLVVHIARELEYHVVGIQTVSPTAYERSCEIAKVMKLRHVTVQLAVTLGSVAIIALIVPLAKPFRNEQLKGTRLFIRPGRC